jgi:hypothetical protein
MEMRKIYVWCDREEEKEICDGEEENKLPCSFFFKQFKKFNLINFNKKKN